tara:strand:+ start:310 stop:588 length:279 start_codon:yes stop_codon:yes gene_type:complete
MNKTDIIEALAKESDITKTLASNVVNSLFTMIGDSLLSGEKVVVSDFGTFTVSLRKEFEGINPRTGERIVIPSRRVPVFRAGKQLKTSLNKE